MLQKRFPQNPEYSNFSNLTDLKNILPIIQQKISATKTEKQKKEEEHKDNIRILVEKNEKQAQNIDKKKEKILKFLGQIGFDLLPQDITDLKNNFSLDFNTINKTECNHVLWVKKLTKYYLLPLKSPLSPAPHLFQ